MLIGAEPERPYERPPLSKDYLRGEVGREKVYVHDEGFYAEHDIELRLGRTAVEPRHGDAARSRSTTASGCATTGCCSPPAPSRAGSPIPGADARRRALPAQRRGLRRAARAAGPRRLGRRGRRRLDRRRGRRLGPPARPRRHRRRPAHGPARARARRRGRRDLPRHPRRPRRADAARAPASRPSRATTAVERVRTSDGRALDCDFVVVGVGVQPRTELAAQAGLAVDDGILVDEHLQTERARRVRRRRRRQRPAPVLRRADPRRALGQRAAPGPGRRAQHARSARTPTTACRTSSPTSTTSAWSTRASPATWDRVVFRGDPASREFIAFWLARRPRRGGHERQRLGRHRPDPAAHPRARAPSTTGASPTPTCRSRSSRPSRKAARHEPPPATARRRRLDLARHALARAARQRRVRGADRRLRGHRRDLEPDDLRQGDHRLRPLRRPAPRRRRRRRRATRRSCSSSSRSTTSAAPPTCCAPPTTRAAGATASSPSSARPTSPTTPRPRSSRRSSCGAGSHGPT